MLDKLFVLQLKKHSNFFANVVLCVSLTPSTSIRAQNLIQHALRLVNPWVNFTQSAQLPAPLKDKISSLFLFIFAVLIKIGSSCAVKIEFDLKRNKTKHETMKKHRSSSRNKYYN
jgi:hypothetical protein